MEAGVGLKEMGKHAAKDKGRRKDVAQKKKYDPELGKLEE